MPSIWKQPVSAGIVNANHLRSATSGWVTGLARPYHIGRTTHVWHIELRDDADKLTCISRITMAVLVPPGTVA